MRVNPHDAYEACVQSPDNELIELSDEITKILQSHPDLGAELRERLAECSAWARCLVPTVEKLIEIGEDVWLPRREELQIGSDALTPFKKVTQPGYVERRIGRLAAARSDGDAGKAANLRDILATYAVNGCSANVRDACVNALRRDGIDDGETPSANHIASPRHLRQDLMQAEPA